MTEACANGQHDLCEVREWEEPCDCECHFSSTMNVEEYIRRSDNDEPGYDAYLGEDDQGKHWFLDPVQGIEWAFEDQPAGWPPDERPQ